MDIKTKFSIGEVVWYYGHNGLEKYVIDSILIAIESKSKISIEYLSAAFHGMTKDQVKKKEDKLYPSKEELIKTL